MWRDDVMFDDEEQVRSHAERRAREDVLSIKSMQMLFFYVILVSCTWLVLGAYGFGTRHERGVVAILALWLCHIDASSWCPKSPRSSTRSTRLAAGVVHFAKSSRWLTLAVAIAPLVSGLMAMPWGIRLSFWGVSVRLAQALFIWVNALGLLATWTAMMAPGELSLLEQSASTQLGRAWVTVKRTIWPLVFSMISWRMFCMGAGWL